MHAVRVQDSVLLVRVPCSDTAAEAGDRRAFFPSFSSNALRLCDKLRQIGPDSTIEIQVHAAQRLVLGHAAHALLALTSSISQTIATQRILGSTGANMPLASSHDVSYCLSALGSTDV